VRYALDAPEAPWGDESWRHPLGRKAVFLGDLVDRGPNVLDTVRIVRNMVTAGTAFCIAGNHDVKFMRWLHGKQVQVKHGLEQSIAEVESLSPEERAKVASYHDGLVIRHMRERKLTFDEAISVEPDFNIVEKWRLNRVRRELFEQLAQTPFA